MPRLILDDCVSGMRSLDGDSVDLVVTSPPYGDLRKFGGHRFTWDVFEGVAEELWRLVKPGGVVCWQEGDQVTPLGQWAGSYSGLSYRHALHLQNLGFLIHEVLITGSCGSRYPIPRRYKRAPIYVFVLTRGRPATVNLLRDRKNKEVGGSFRHNERRDDGTVAIRETGYVTQEYGVRRTVWLYPAGGTEMKIQHPALMHEGLARDLIRSYSNAGDLVCDPFAGACTTGKLAVLLGRDFLGYEIHEPYHRLGLERLNQAMAAISSRDSG